MFHFSHRSTLGSLFASSFIWLFLLSTLTVSAQATPTPINIGDNQSGELTDARGTALYSVEVGAPQGIVVLVLAVTPGFAPDFRLLDPNGILLLDSANPGTANIAQGLLTCPIPVATQLKSAAPMPPLGST